MVPGRAARESRVAFVLARPERVRAADESLGGQAWARSLCLLFTVDRPHTKLLRVRAAPYTTGTRGANTSM